MLTKTNICSVHIFSEVTLLRNSSGLNETCVFNHQRQNNPSFNHQLFVQRYTFCTFTNLCCFVQTVSVLLNLFSN